MLPVLEIRGSMIYALANNINPALAFGLSVIGNILPIPFLILLTQKVLQWLDTIDTFKPFVDWINKKAQEKARQSTSTEDWGSTFWWQSHFLEQALGLAHWWHHSWD